MIVTQVGQTGLLGQNTGCLPGSVLGMHEKAFSIEENFTTIQHALDPALHRFLV